MSSDLGRDPAAIATRPQPPTGVLPSLPEMLAHPIRSLAFVGALLRDRRVHPARKLVFVVPLVVLVAALLAPESLLGAAAGVLLPLLGVVLSVPIDAALDWVVAGLIGYGLLRVFPAEILREHHQRIFHRASAR
jgi:hypothetical protein